MGIKGLSHTLRSRQTALLQGHPHLSERKASGKLQVRPEYRALLRHFLSIDDLARRLTADIAETGALDRKGVPTRTVAELIRVEGLLLRLSVQLGIASKVDHEDEGADDDSRSPLERFLGKGQRHG